MLFCHWTQEEKRLKEEVQKMSPATVEKRRAVLINVAYIALVLGAFYLFMKYAFWTVAPFVFAFLVAAALQRPTNFLSKKTHIKKGIVSVIAVLLIIALLITIVALTGARVVAPRSTPPTATRSGPTRRVTAARARRRSANGSRSFRTM